MEKHQMSKKYPVTKEVFFEENYFGYSLKDPYVWLEEKENKEVIQWTKAQNQLTDDYFQKCVDADIQTIKQELYDQATKVTYANEYEFPDKIIATKTDVNGDISIVILDRNYNELEVIADADRFDQMFDIYGALPSPNDNGICALFVNRKGAARPSVLVYNYLTKELLCQIDQTFSFVWAADGDTLYFSDAEEDLHKGITIHHVKTYHWKKDEVNHVYLYEKHAPFLTLRKSHCGRFVGVHANTDYANNELFIIETNANDVHSVTGELQGNFKYIGTSGKNHYLVTNYENKYGKVMAVPIEANCYEHATEMIKETTNIIQDGLVIDGKVIILYMHDVAAEIKVFNESGVFETQVELPSDIGAINGYFGEDIERSALGNIYINFESFVDAPMSIRYHLQTNTSEIAYLSKEVKNKEEIIVRKEMIIARDGTQLPAFIVHHKDIQLDGSNPTIMYGYGGYNVALTPSFENPFIGMEIPELIQKGFVYVHCNIRGGSEFGVDWHNAGRLLKKKNVFNDFIDIAEHLIANQWTCSDKLAICGGSNGGLLMTTLVTMRPDLWKAVIASVPHTDMIRFKNDDRGPMYITEYGDPEQDKEMFEYMLSYSPYHNIKNEKYPSIYVQTGELDNNVPSYHGKKFVAKMQKMNQSACPVLLRVLPEGSHDLGKGDYYFQTVAEMYLFIKTALQG